MAIITNAFTLELDYTRYGLELLVNREKEIEKIVEVIKSKFGDSKQRVSIRGDRGVGKTFLVHIIKDRLDNVANCISLLIPVDRETNMDTLFRQFCKDLACKIEEFLKAKKNDRALAEVQWLKNMADHSKLSNNFVETKIREIEGKFGVSVGILGCIKAKLEGGAKSGGSTAYGAMGEMEITKFTLREMTSQIIKRIRAEYKQNIVIFWDGLDQLTNKNEIEHVVKEICKLDEAIHVLVLRNEIQSREIKRILGEPPNLIKPFNDGKSLLDIVKRRVCTLDFKHKDALLHTNLKKTYNVLAELEISNGNPYYFLRWLTFLTRETDIDREPTKLKEYLIAYFETMFPGIKLDMLEELYKLYSKNKFDKISAQKIMEVFSLDTHEFTRLTESEIILPDNILNPLSYKASPDLRLIKLIKKWEKT